MVKVSRSFVFLPLLVLCVEGRKELKEFNEVDMERLFEQWEENDEPLEPDELPAHKKEPPQIDMSKMDFKNPEEILKASKKGRTLMVFVKTYDKTREEADQLTSLWQASLQNSHIQAERFMIEDDRVIFMFKDGSQAWEAKDFLIDQPFCDSVMIENKPYYGRHRPVSKDSKDEL